MSATTAFEKWRTITDFACCKQFIVSFLRAAAMVVCTIAACFFLPARSGYSAQVYYEVWRNTQDDLSSATRIASWITGTSYNDTNVLPEDMFYYWVRGYSAETVTNSWTNLTYSLDVSLTCPTAAQPGATTPVKAKVTVGGGIFGVQTGTLRNEISSNHVTATWQVPNVSNFLTSPYVREWPLEIPLGDYEPFGTTPVSYGAQYLDGLWLFTPPVNVSIGSFSQPGPSVAIAAQPNNVVHLSWNSTSGNTMYSNSASLPLPTYLTMGHDLTLLAGYHYSVGDFGSSQPSMDPLFGIDQLGFSGTEVFGNNVETQNGWESTRTWEPYQIPGDTTWRVTKGFASDTILKGQYSRVGKKPGNLAILGVGFINDAEWRTRDLETQSQGGVQFQDVGADPLRLQVQLDYDVNMNGSSLEKNAAAAINLIPTVVTTATTTTKLADFTPKLLRKVGQSQVLKWTVALQQQLVTERSDFFGSAEMQLDLMQNGQVIGTIDTSSEEFTPDSVGAKYGCYVIKTTSTVTGQTTLFVDPTKPLEYQLNIATHVKALGTAQSYMGVTGYRIEFSTPDHVSVPLVIHRQDPAGTPGVFRSLLYGTVNTPELIEGNVQLVESLGAYVAAEGENLVTFDNTGEVSGFTMPVALADSDSILSARIAAMTAADTGLENIGVQIGFTTGEDFISLFEGSLADFGDFTLTSEVAEMPFGSDFIELNIDITALPRGEGMFLFGFGNLDTSEVSSTLVMDSFLVVPEPRSLVLLLVSGACLLWTWFRKM